MIFKLNVLDLGILTIIIFSFIFYAQFGLVCNLKFPNLLWTNEAVPVKQGMSVTITLFGSWAFIVTLGGMYFILRALVTPYFFLLVVEVVLIAGNWSMNQWLRTKGEAIFFAAISFIQFSNFSVSVIFSELVGSSKISKRIFLLSNSRAISTNCF